jgi:copper chaperone CopZ
MTTATYYVSGMTCDHCVKAIKQEVGAIDGVTRIDVDLIPDEISPITITSREPLDEGVLAQAVDDAGYTLVAAPGPKA